MSTRSIEAVIEPKGTHFVGDGFKVHNIIPGNQGLSMERMSPFIMMDYNAPHYFPPSERPRGVGVHPHRGFETVTIGYKGRIEHHDSSGGGGVIGEGDVQWMTAASGVLHKEFHETAWSKEGGEFQMVQLWVNLPAKDKMSTPKYQAITNAEIPKIALTDNSGVVEVIAGNYQGHAGAATTFTPVHLLNVQLNNDGKARFSFPSHYNTSFLVLEGSVVANDASIAHANTFTVLRNDGEDFHIQALEPSKVLVLSGEPILEPIVHYGPFVMNTHEQINEAIRDYNEGKFGHLV